MARIVHCISTPRNVSTAMMYSWAQRADTTVVDEPFYAHYLSHRNVDHPGREEILASQPHDYREVLKRLQAVESDILYVKNMAHHLRLIPLRAVESWQTVILIRNPQQLIASFARIIENVTMSDIGIADQRAQFRYLQRQNTPLVVIDAGELLNDPEPVLRELCDRLGLAFEPGMLSWQKGPRVEDGVWARHWYANVHKSTGFEVQQSGQKEFPEQYRTLLEEAEGYYRELFSHAIKS